MQKQSCTRMVVAFLLLFIMQGCHAQLMCYICENCPQITLDTPLEACNAEHFNGETTRPPMQTTVTPIPTTERTKTTMTTITKWTTTPTTTITTAEPTTTTEKDITETTTEEPMPTPPTVGPPETTTSVPTPPTRGIFETFATEGSTISNVNRSTDAFTTSTAAITEKISTTTSSTSTSSTDDRTNATLFAGNRNYTASTEFRVRQVRALINTDVTYHCYSIKRNVNGTVQTDRGCSRVTANEGVCTQLKKQNVVTPIDKCTGCSMPKCNGCSTLSASAAIVSFTLLAIVLGRSN